MSYERACKAIQSTIRDSAYYGSKEQVDAINNHKERVGVIRDSNKQVDAKSEAKSYRDYVFRNEFETMNVFDQGNNSGSRINPESRIIPDSRINLDSRINSPIQPNFNIPLTRPTGFELLTRPTDFELFTQPTDFELLTRPTEFSEKNEKEHELEVNPDPEPSSSYL